MRESVSVLKRADVANADGVFARAPVFERIPAEVLPIEKDDVIRAGLDTTETFYRVEFRNVKRGLTPWGENAPGLVGRETAMPFNAYANGNMANSADPTNLRNFNFGLSQQIANFRFLRVFANLADRWVSINAARNSKAGSGAGGITGQGDSGGILAIDDADTRSVVLRLTMGDGAQRAVLFRLADNENRQTAPPDGNRYLFFDHPDRMNPTAAALIDFVGAYPVADRAGATLDFALVENSAGWLDRGGKEVRIAETPVINKNDIVVWHTNVGLELEVIRADIPPFSAINRDIVARLKQ